jgi:hypothetical protein
VSVKKIFTVEGMTNNPTAGKEPHRKGDVKNLRNPTDSGS